MKVSINTDFEEIGWMPHKALIQLPKKDFGFGEKFACDISQLKKPELLKALMK
ncbi:hypothetical protein M0R72_02905 [Candidatus Pacearchaeota archaeon]|nr:hypothetical protein [Candidatus Pacearchaeota archaeon]